MAAQVECPRAAPRAGGKHPGVVLPSHMIGGASPMLCSAVSICSVGLVLTYISVTVAVGACKRRGRSGRSGCRATMRAVDGQTRAGILPDQPV